MKIHAITLMALAAACAAGAEVVAVARPRQVTESDGLVLVGRVLSPETVRLTARVSGELLESNGEEGALVKKGDVLLRIEDAAYRANLQTAQAKLAELEARLRHADSEVERYSAGEAEGSISKDDTVRAILNRDVIRAQIVAAKAQIAQCEADLAHCVVRSPIDGAIGADPVAAGNNVGPGSGTLMEVFSIDPVDIAVAVPEAVRIDCMGGDGEKKIEKYTLLRANGKPYPVDLQVHSVSKKVDAATGTVKVTLRGANPDGALTPGGYVKLIVQEVYRTPRLAVPMAAVVFEGDECYAYVVADGRASKRRIEIGDQAGDLVFVGSGLSMDDDVVVSGVHKLADGTAVTVGKD